MTSLTSTYLHNLRLEQSRFALLSTSRNNYRRVDYITFWQLAKTRSRAQGHYASLSAVWSNFQIRSLTCRDPRDPLIATCKLIRIPESRKFMLVGSGILALESRIPLKNEPESTCWKSISNPSTTRGGAENRKSIWLPLPSCEWVPSRNNGSNVDA